MATSTNGSKLSDPELEVLEALDDADPTGTRRTELADAVSVDYPATELELTNRDLVEDAGADLVRSDDGDALVEYQRVALTDAGKRALKRARAPAAGPEPVGPTTRPSRSSHFNEADWRTLSETVARLVDETDAVEYDADREVVQLTLTHDGETATLEISEAAWLNTGRVQFLDEYRTFGESPSLDDREFGAYQARVIDRYVEANSGEE